ncbi:DedA Uncharacterized membrane-associated protein [Rhabdaerophilaceae bacterium]
MPFDISAERIVAFVHANGDYAPLIIFLMAFAETIVVLSVLVPSTVLFLAISGLMAASGVPLVPSLIAGGLGSSLGFSLMYMLSSAMQGRILTAWPLRNYPDTVAQALDFSRRWGAMGVMIGHFAGPLRVVIPIAAGISRMPPLSFMLANIVGAFGWITVFFAPGYLVVSSEWFRTTFSGVIAMLPWLK